MRDRCCENISPSFNGYRELFLDTAQTAYAGKERKFWRKKTESTRTVCLQTCLKSRVQCRYRPAVFLLLFNMQAVSLGSGLKFHIVIISVVTYVLNIMHQIVKVGRFM